MTNNLTPMHLSLLELTSLTPTVSVCMRLCTCTPPTTYLKTKRKKGMSTDKR